ncbi:hypothetical protein [Formosa sp. PL04]|uniref:hypothetical protein n=1 Tax=Formosa sp. PL04 TaxID=3081755 RepID=UPI002980EA47|nr:hypothetical protein [Formosa sp. PL04]MDW5290837.1 hypothetical protein [Formosa sp. PL04]
MKANKIVLLIIIISSLGCRSQVRSDKLLDVVEISNFNYGKIHLSFNEIEELSKATGVEKRFFTSCIYYQSGEQRVSFPINDKYFNHEYFENINYDSPRKANLYVKKYINAGKEYAVAIKIE